MKTAEEILKEVISESDYFISEDHWVWTIAIKAMEEYSKENLREELGKVWRFMAIDGNDRKTIDEYLKQKQFK